MERARQSEPSLSNIGCAIWYLGLTDYQPDSGRAKILPSQSWENDSSVLSFTVHWANHYCHILPPFSTRANLRALLYEIRPTYRFDPPFLRWPLNVHTRPTQILQRSSSGYSTFISIFYEPCPLLSNVSIIYHSYVVTLYHVPCYLADSTAPRSVINYCTSISYSTLPHIVSLLWIAFVFLSPHH